MINELIWLTNYVSFNFGNATYQKQYGGNYLLQNNLCITFRVGVQSFIDAQLKVAPKRHFDIFHTADDEQFSREIFCP